MMQDDFKPETGNLAKRIELIRRFLQNKLSKKSSADWALFAQATQPIPLNELPKYLKAYSNEASFKAHNARFAKQLKLVKDHHETRNQFEALKKPRKTNWLYFQKNVDKVIACQRAVRRLQSSNQLIKVNTKSGNHSDSAFHFFWARKKTYTNHRICKK